MKPCPFCRDKYPFVERMKLYSYAAHCSHCLATGRCTDEDSTRSRMNMKRGDRLPEWPFLFLTH